MSADRSPLWKVMHNAHNDASDPFGNAALAAYAAEIRAVASWIEQRQVNDYGSPSSDAIEVIEWLTAEADRAEQGDHFTNENV